MEGIQGITLEELLKSREDRARRQRELIKLYDSPLISVTLNIPGPIKYNSLYKKIHEVAIREILKKIQEYNYEILYKEIIDKPTGSEGYIAVKGDSVQLKKAMIEIEDDHCLGRIFDIDVIDKSMGHISRKLIGKPSRKCLLCQRDALLCKRDGKHSLEELLERIQDLSSVYFNIKGNFDKI